MSAVSGVRVQTEKVWEYANEFAIPACLFINKMDRERADFSRTIGDLQKSFPDKSIGPCRYLSGRRKLSRDDRFDHHEGIHV